MIITKDGRVEVAIQIRWIHRRDVLIGEQRWAIVIVIAAKKIKWIKVREEALNGILLLELLVWAVKAVQEISDWIILSQVGKEPEYGTLLLLVALVVIIIVAVRPKPAKEWRPVL